MTSIHVYRRASFYAAAAARVSERARDWTRISREARGELEDTLDEAWSYRERVLDDLGEFPAASTLALIARGDTALLQSSTAISEHLGRSDYVETAGEHVANLMRVWPEVILEAACGPLPQTYTVVESGRQNIAPSTPADGATICRLPIAA